MASFDAVAKSMAPTPVRPVTSQELADTLRGSGETVGSGFQSILEALHNFKNQGLINR